MRVIAVIPARYASTRLPGKPLKNIDGKPMIWWVYHNVMEADCFDKVIVAVDDERISAVCRQYDMQVVMTKNDHPTALHRLHEVAQVEDADLYVQVNGDEPLLPSYTMRKFRAALSDYGEKEGEYAVNIITEIHDPAEAIDTSNIKMVFDSEYRCLYMSRTPIPCPFKSLEFNYYKHVGMIAYSKAALCFYVNSQPGRLEMIEGIDLLRFIDYGKAFYLWKTDGCSSLSVDTEKDLDEVRKRALNLRADTLPSLNVKHNSVLKSDSPGKVDDRH